MGKNPSHRLSQPDPQALDAARRGVGRLWACPVCRTQTDRPHRRGHGALEAVLYLAWFVPGIVYTVWRRARDPDVCPTCGYYPMIPLDAMLALSSAARDHRPCPWCAEDILAEAIVCKHCGRDVPRASR